jgi:hypothetical protein
MDNSDASVEAGYQMHALYRKLKNIFPEIKPCGLIPKFYIHVSVSDSLIPMISPIVGYINRSQIHECGS